MKKKQQESSWKRIIILIFTDFHHRQHCNRGPFEIKTGNNDSVKAWPHKRWHQRGRADANYSSDTKRWMWILPPRGTFNHQRVCSAGLLHVSEWWHPHCWFLNETVRHWETRLLGRKCWNVAELNGENIRYIICTDLAAMTAGIFKPWHPPQRKLEVINFCHVLSRFFYIDYVTWYLLFCRLICDQFVSKVD